MPRFFHVSAISGLLLSLALPSPALASAQTAADLFEQGVALLAAEKVAEACSFFEESLKAEESAGTALNLADCHVREGKTGAAYHEFQQAAQLAEKIGWTELVTEAQKRAQDLAATFGTLTIEVAAPVDGLTLRQGETALTSNTWGQPSPMPPGTYTILAEAPGHEPWSQTIDMAEASQVVTVPALQVSPPPPVEAPVAQTAPAVNPRVKAAQPSSSDTPSAIEHLPSWILFGTAGAFAVGAGITGYIALDKEGKLESQCPDHDSCPADAKGINADLESSANTLALTADILWGVAAVAAAAGATFWVLTDEESTTKEHIALTPALGPSNLGVVATGTF